jgi:hypothetical protein
MRPPAIACPSRAGTGRGSEGDWRAGNAEGEIRNTELSVAVLRKTDHEQRTTNK